MTSILAWQNYVKSATIFGYSAATSMPASNVAGDLGSPSTAWQTVAGVVTSAGGAKIDITIAAHSPWRVAGLFGTNLTAAASVTFEFWFVGFGSPNQSVTVAGPAAGFGQVVCALAADQSADLLRIKIDDPTNPDGFINVPLIFGGPAWLPASSAGFSSTIGRDDSTLETVSRGGQEYPTLLWQRRRWDIALDGIRATETWTQADALNRYAKAGSNVFFAPDSGSAYIQQEAIFGRLKSTADISFPYQGADRRRWSASITERL